MQQIVVQRRSLWGPLFADLERVLPWDTRLVTIDPQGLRSRQAMRGTLAVASGVMSPFSPAEGMSGTSR